MGARGPAPTPSAILNMRGSWRGKKNPNEPRGPEGRPACPRWLRKDARKAWRVLIPQLDVMGVLSKIDGNTLARYCEMWARWKEAAVFLQQRGESYPLRNEAGEVVGFRAWPQVKVADVLAKQLRSTEDRFGMSPSARTRLVAQTDEGRKVDEEKRSLLNTA